MGKGDNRRTHKSLQRRSSRKSKERLRKKLMLAQKKS